MTRIGFGSGLVALAVMLATGAAAEMMSVQVRESAVRATPSFLGQVVTSLSYGTKVTVVEKTAAWVKVSTAEGVSGWMSQSALTPKRIVMTAGQGEVETGASSEDLALAGKGFNSDVEAQFKSRNSEINFSAVDRMEKRSVSKDEMIRFLREGGVKASQGGAQ